MSKLTGFVVTVFLLLAGVPAVQADDTELFSSANPSGRQKVLIIFDGSGSMNKNVPGDNKSRRQVAEEVVTNLVNTNKNVDFGLMLFNGNDGSTAGGRVVHRIIPNMTDADRNSLNAMVKVDDGKPYPHTTLCETSYEAMRYFSGGNVFFGNKVKGAPPPKDSNAESGGKYISPLSCENTYLIVLTDGKPTNDDEADSAVQTLTGKTCGTYDGTYSCLPLLAEYLNTTDLDGDDTNGTQRVLTYTIGFQTDQVLLEATAEMGGGEYFTANNSAELTTAFQDALLDIKLQASEAVFTSPVVAVDTFNRTRSRDDLFMAMFKPGAGDRWLGNIKKLKVNVSSGVAEIRDSNNQPAIDDASGRIRDSATTFWSSGADGSEVDKGGAGALLAARNPATRTIKTNSGNAGALEDFSSTNLTYDAFGLANIAELFAFFDVNGQPALDDLISWSRGVDVTDEDEDGSSVDNRTWILGDILHSLPLAINYGALGSFTEANPDIRLVVGTNAGFLHMFGTGDGVEDWAFFPKELAPVLNKRLANISSASHAYAIDATPVAWTRDVNRDGTLSAAAGDKVYLYFGLRRGGRAYYALDLSNPAIPAFKWMIDNTTAGFSELGQTWSDPVPTTVPGYVDGSGKHKPVLVFGGGFDAANKDTTLVASADSMGRAIYIVDADSGTLLWSVSPAASAGANLQETGLAHGVAARTMVLDSNGDGVTDRVYAADTGGNVWRVDLPGTDRSKWSIVKFAALNGGDVANDRRFFNTPDIVRTRYGSVAFDAVLLGSGEHNNPLARDVNNRFYLLRDRQVTPYYSARPTAAECGTDATPGSRYGDFRCSLPLGETDLYNATANLVQDGSGSEVATAQAALYSSPGWYITLEHSGEKSLSSSITFNGNVLFTTFSPDVAANANQCIPSPGQGYLYAVNLLDASSVYNFTGGVALLEKIDRVATMGKMVLGTPSPHVGEDGRIRLIFPAGGTGGTDVDEVEGSVFDTGGTISGAKADYWYQEEY
jgi:type IV pilus assembly protein PilY1